MEGATEAPIEEDDDIFVHEWLDTDQSRSRGTGRGLSGLLGVDEAKRELEAAVVDACRAMKVESLAPDIQDVCYDMIIVRGLGRRRAKAVYYRGFSRCIGIQNLIRGIAYVFARSEGVELMKEDAFPGLRGRNVRKVLELICKVYDVPIPSDSVSKPCQIVVGMLVGAVQKKGYEPDGLLGHVIELRRPRDEKEGEKTETSYRKYIFDSVTGFNYLTSEEGSLTYEYLYTSYPNLVSNTMNTVEWLCKLLGCKNLDITRTPIKVIIICILALRITAAMGKIFKCCDGICHSTFIDSVFTPDKLAPIYATLTGMATEDEDMNSMIEKRMQLKAKTAKTALYSTLINNIRATILRLKSENDEKYLLWNLDFIFDKICTRNVDSMIYKITPILKEMENHISLFEEQTNKKCKRKASTNKESVVIPQLKKVPERLDSDHLNDFLRTPEEVKFMENLWVFGDI